VRPLPLILDLLRCPACGGTLQASATETAADGHIMEGTLACTACAARYPIRRGVPRLVPLSLANDVEETVEAFGWQWTQANAIIRDPRFSAPALFLDFIHPVEPGFFVGKIVLDGGCGLGRFTLAAAGFGARLVIGVDLSSSVDVAFDNTRHLEHVVIVQADLLSLPIAPRIDYGFSVGVLHHTADPRGGFLRLASKVVPGGGVSAWVYGREHNGWVVHILNPVRRLTSRLPRRLLLALSYVAAAPLALAVHGVYAPVAKHATLRWLRGRLFYYTYMVFLAQFDYRTLAFIIFDHAVPTIAEYIRREAFAEWFVAAGLEQIEITSKGGNSWRGFGRVPAALPQETKQGSPVSASV
jgi:SAM-dependent methyltransferase